MSYEKRNNASGSSTTASFKRNDFTATAGQTSFTLTFNLTSSSVVFYNGTILSSTEYSGTGTKILTLTTAANEYDTITVIG